MKACWLYPWLAWMGNWPLLEWRQPPLTFTSMILLMGVAFFAARFLPARRWGRGRTGTSLVIMLLLAFLVIIRIEYRAGFDLLDPQWFARTGQILVISYRQLNPLVIALPSGIYLIWWGIRLGNSPISFSRIYRAFFTGLIGLVIILIVLASGSGAAVTSPGVYAAGFFFCGLAALALGNRRIFPLKTSPEGRARFSARRFWIVLAFIAGIVICGVVLAVSLGGADSWENLVTALKTAGDWLYDNVITHLLNGLGYLIAGLFYVLNFIFNLVFSPPDFDPSEAAGEATPEPTPSTVTPMVVPEEVVLALKWAGLAALAALVVYLLVKAYQSYAAGGVREGVDEERESLWSWDLFRSDLRLFLLMLWSKFKRSRSTPAAGETVPAWYNDEAIPYQTDVRDIYRHLLWEAAAAGINRFRHETTDEYARRLIRAVPEDSEPVIEINRLYALTRYGDQLPSQPQLDMANRLWQTMCRRLRLRRAD
jgi:hypothetical protein